ncbi:MAG TPA: hypothetical protein DCY63_02325 [Acidimicrobiaceae bacterium]|nr:hypothetical protein [Acidimicrobiaceae bacterium]
MSHEHSVRCAVCRTWTRSVL